MGVLTTVSPRARRVRLGMACVLLAATFVAPPTSAADTEPDIVALKAAFLYNFAKFAEWPNLPPGAPLVLCIVGDDAIAAALVGTIHGQNIGGHSVEVSRPSVIAAWTGCHLLFIAHGAAPRAAGLVGIKTQPILTVSDVKDFSQAGGMIELFVEGGRIRFAINVDAVDRAGLRISSRLLGLAKIIKSGQAP